MYSASFVRRMSLRLLNLSVPVVELPIKESVGIATAVTLYLEREF